MRLVNEFFCDLLNFKYKQIERRDKSKRKDLMSIKKGSHETLKSKFTRAYYLRLSELKNRCCTPKKCCSLYFFNFLPMSGHSGIVSRASILFNICKKNFHQLADAVFFFVPRVRSWHDLQRFEVSATFFSASAPTVAF